MRLAFGRYLAYDSIIHKMDPRIKLAMMFILIATIFFPNGYTGYLVLGITIFSLYFIAKLKFRLLFTLVKPILFMFVILLIVYCFLNTSPHDNLGWRWGGGGAHGGVSWFVFSERSIFLSLYLGIRIYFMITVTTILTSSTKPLDMTLGLEDLMSPLKLIRFPVHIISMIIVIALRMIPTLIEEAGRIMKAQASRGIDFRNGKFHEKVKSTVSLIIPLLVSAFQKAEELAYAMDARGYDPHGKRTRYRQYHLRYVDVIVFIVFVGIAATIITYDYTSFVPTKYTLHYLDKFVKL